MSTGESRLSQNLSLCCLVLVSGAGAAGNPVFNLLFDPAGRPRTELNRLRKIALLDISPQSGLRQPTRATTSSNLNTRMTKPRFHEPNIVVFTPANIPKNCQINECSKVALDSPEASNSHTKFPPPRPLGHPYFAVYKRESHGKATLRVTYGNSCHGRKPWP